MDKFIEDIKAAVKDFRTYLVAALIAFLGWANVQSNEAIDSAQEQIDSLIEDVRGRLE